MQQNMSPEIMVQWIEKYVQYIFIVVERITTHLLSIERADWLKPNNKFKGRKAKTLQTKFPVGFPVGVCALNLLFICNFHDVVCIERRCMIKALIIRSIFAGKTALAFTRPSIFSICAKSNYLTERICLLQYMFCRHGQVSLIAKIMSCELSHWQSEGHDSDVNMHRGSSTI